MTIEGCDANCPPTCRAGDIPAITRIYADAVLHGTATFEIEPPDEAEMTRRMAALLAGNYPYLVAEIGADVAGYAYADRTGHGRRIDGAWKIRSMSIGHSTAAASAWT